MARQPKRTKPKKPRAKRGGSVAPSATGDANATSDREVDSLIKNLDAPSLHSDDVTDILLHCASVLNLRRAMTGDTAASAQSSANYCYTKSGDSPTVSIWSGGFKVGESSEADAKANGIPPCG
jgi:hypothetical protein